MGEVIISLFISGLLFGSGPCIASCGPVLIPFIAGTNRGVFNGLKTYVIFSLARIFSYIILSIGVFFLGSFTLQRLLGGYSKYISLLAGAFIILLGLLMVLGKRLGSTCSNLTTGFARKPWRCLQENMLENDKKSITTLGLITGFLPCAPLLAIFSYSGLISKSWVKCLLYSFSFGIGTFLSPLILLVILAGFIPKIVKKKSALFSQIFCSICGLIIIFLGVQLIAGFFR